MHVRTYVPTYVCIPVVPLGMHQAHPSPVRVVHSISAKKMQTPKVQRIFVFQKDITKNLSILLRCGLGGEGGGASCWEELGAVETG
jgi:hypothetical protein